MSKFGLALGGGGAKLIPWLGSLLGDATFLWLYLPVVSRN
jgi:hypothetical protein